MTNLLQIESDARCVKVIRRWIDSDEEHVWTALTNESWRAALEALVAAELAPADWPSRVDLWHKEVGPEFNLHNDRTYLSNVIDARALPVLLRNPKAAVNAEALLREQLLHEADYAGIRSWEALRCGENSGWIDVCLRPSRLHRIGHEVGSLFKGPEAEEWFASMQGADWPIASATPIVFGMVDRLLADSKPWALELARTGCGFVAYPPLRASRVVSFALVVRDGDGYPWPRLLAG